jgi:hypothetical protein
VESRIFGASAVEAALPLTTVVFSMELEEPDSALLRTFSADALNRFFNTLVVMAVTAVPTTVPMSDPARPI